MAMNVAQLLTRLIDLDPATTPASHPGAANTGPSKLDPVHSAAANAS
jgi:hypothetical protein